MFHNKNKCLGVFLQIIKLSVGRIRYIIEYMDIRSNIFLLEVLLTNIESNHTSYFNFKFIQTSNYFEFFKIILI
jgi:hypothetical protein